MSSSEHPKAEYEDEIKLIEDYKNLVLSNPQCLEYAANSLFESLVEEACLGLCFQSHFESKYPDIFGPSSSESSGPSSKHSSSHSDYGGNNKFMNCKCLNCEKTISVSKYASHLENCMGLGRNSSRIASRKNKTNNNTYYDLPDDYDDDPESDANWSAKEKTKKKLGSNGRNGKNKNKGYNM